MNGQNRSDVKIGATVKIVLKADQRTEKLTEGIVDKILTNSSYHPHGIKVMLIPSICSLGLICLRTLFMVCKSCSNPFAGRY